MAGESILNSVKQVVGLTADNPEFDLDITMLINSAFATLNQIGVGPTQGFAIFDASSTWDEFTGGDPRFNSVRQYVSYKVRLAFDPPATGPLVAAFEKSISEIETRLSILREYLISNPVDEGPVVTPPVDNSADGGTVTNGGVLDGGAPDSVYTGDVYDGGTP